MAVTPEERPTAVPIDFHEWVSFEDDEEDRTWMFDVTFLTSSWTCIFGNGCQGVLTGPAPELGHGCCSYGAHFVDTEDLAAVTAAAARLDASQWQYKPVADRYRKRTGVDHDGFARRQRDSAWITRLVAGACIFLNRPGFPGGAGCALHIAAAQAGERPLDWKPDVCWQLPLRLVESTDEHGHVTSVLREWKRRDWGAGGHDFHWWCTDSADAFRSRTPVYIALADEIIEMVGRGPYEQFVRELERRPRRRFLPHPALRDS